MRSLPRSPPPDLPYNGWGDEGDSLRSVHSLHPKPPRKDIVKLITNQSAELRLSAKFRNPQLQDARREFLIVFYLVDDTLAIFERYQRNSGFKGGKFIKCGKWRNPAAGNRHFLAADLKIGDVITINGFTFVTGVADEYALNFMEAQAPEFPQADLADIVRICRTQPQRVDRLRRNFEAVDRELVEYVPGRAPSQTQSGCSLTMA
jgi:hypothetical protein